MIRITGGRFRGRRIHAPTGREIRPSSARLRQAVLDSIAPLEGTRGADLFCGVGTFGLEALSRRAEHVLFLDRAEEALRLLERNLGLLGLKGASRVARIDLLRPAARRLARWGPFDWVFADPPYALREDPRRGPAVERLLEEVGRGGLAEGGVLLLEHRARAGAEPRLQGLRCTRTRRYGDGSVSWFEPPRGTT